MRMADRLDSSCALGAIRQGMIMMIPLLVVGYLAAMLINLPIPAYQTFIEKLCGGHVLEILKYPTRAASVIITKMIIFPVPS